MNLGIKVVFSGRKEHLPKSVLESMNYISSKTKDNQNGVFNVCLNYGGCEEIIDACKKIINNNIKVEDINKDMFYHYLYQFYILLFEFVLLWVHFHLIQKIVFLVLF
mgnify:CR=1 FL=1